MPLLGQQDHLPDHVVIRIIVADPRDISRALRPIVSRTFLLDQSSLLIRLLYSNTTKHASISGNEIKVTSPPFSTTTDYPFILGSSLYFLMCKNLVLVMLGTRLFSLILPFYNQFSAIETLTGMDIRSGCC